MHYSSGTRALARRSEAGAEGRRPPAEGLYQTSSPDRARWAAAVWGCHHSSFPETCWELVP